MDERLAEQGAWPPVKGRTRIVGFLGTTHYRPVQHGWLDGHTANRTTGFSMVAAARHLGLDASAGDEVCVLATDDAWKANGEQLNADLASEGLPGARIPRPFLAQTGQPADLWQHFARIRDAVTRGMGADDRVVIDVTYGFRSQPVMAAVVIGHLAALDERPPDIRVIYAALEAGEPREAARKTWLPFWDLTPLVRVAESSRDLGLFVRTGRAGGLAGTLNRLGAEVRRQRWEAGEAGASHLAALARALTTFADDLATVRLGALLHGRRGSAARLYRRLDEAADEVAAVPELAPLRPALDRVRGWIEPLVGPGGEGLDLREPEGLRAMAALARLYLDLDRVLEGVAVIREGQVSRYAGPTARLALGEGERRKAGVDPFDPAARRRAEAAWRLAEGRTANDPSRLRNDLLHAGFQESPGAASTIRKAAWRHLENLESAVASPAPPTPGEEAAAPPVFLNLSNHPSREWEPHQVAAALREIGGEGRIADLPFPEVPPHAGTAELARLRDELLARVPRGAVAAMVQGEFVLTTMLVAALSRRGIRCLAATTAREVSVAGDGTHARRFRFVRFRAYPVAG